MLPPPLPPEPSVKDNIIRATNTVIPIGCAVVFFIVIVLFLRTCAAVADTTSEVLSVPDRPDIVTKGQYNSIHTGMTYEEVYNIIGVHGEELSQNKIEGVKGVMPSITTVMVAWTNPDGTGMNAIFQNGKLNSKSQFGLD